MVAQSCAVGSMPRIAFATCNEGSHHGSLPPVVHGARRTRLATKLDRLDGLERRSNAEPITVTALTIGALPALAQLGLMDPGGGALSHLFVPGGIDQGASAQGLRTARPRGGPGPEDVFPMAIVPGAGRAGRGGGPRRAMSEPRRTHGMRTRPTIG